MRHSVTWVWRRLVAGLVLAGFVVFAVGSLNLATGAAQNTGAKKDKKDQKVEEKKDKKAEAKKDKKADTKKDAKDKKNVIPPPPEKKVIPKDKTAPLFVLKGHTNWINSVEVSPDGKFLVTASRDKTVKVWDLAAKKDVQTFKDHPTNVKIAVFSPDGEHVVAATGQYDKKKKTWEGEIKFWNIKTGKSVRSLTGHADTIEALAFSPDGSQLATGSDDTTAILWDVKAGKAVQTLKGHGASILGIAFNKDGTKVATASTDKTVKIWDARSGKELQTLKGPEREVSGVAFSPDGKLIAAGSLDEKIWIWDAGGKVVHKLEAPEGILTIHFSKDGKYLAGGGWNDTTKVWDTASGKELFYRNGHERTVTGVTFTPDGQRMITAGIDQTVKVWEVPHGK